MVVAEERPRIALQQSFSKLFKDIGLSPRAVSTTFGSRVNVAICLQVTLTGTILAAAGSLRQVSLCCLTLNSCQSPSLSLWGAKMTGVAPHSGLRGSEVGLESLSPVLLTHHGTSGFFSPLSIRWNFGLSQG